jgi:hypothetical protein
MQNPNISSTNLYQSSVQDMQILTFGIKKLDILFKGLRCGDFNVFHGTHTCHIISELLCVRSQLSNALGGLETSAVFIDGGNRFDPYFISDTARFHALDPEEILKNIWISRAFTSHQMTALITEKIPQILDREGSRLVVVSDVSAPYCDTNIGIAEAKNIFNSVILTLWNLAKERNIILVTTSLSSRSKKKKALEQYLLGRADIVARIETDSFSTKITLEKHPFRSSTSTKFFEEMGSQFLLEDFMEI